MLSQTGGNGGMSLTNVRQAFQGMSNALTQVLFMCSHFHKKNVYTSSVLRCSAYLWKSLFIGMFQETNQEAFLREVEGGNFVMGGEHTCDDAI